MQKLLAFLRAFNKSIVDFSTPKSSTLRHFNLRSISTTFQVLKYIKNNLQQIIKIVFKSKSSID